MRKQFSSPSQWKRLWSRYEGQQWTPLAVCLYFPQSPPGKGCWSQCGPVELKASLSNWKSALSPFVMIFQYSTPRWRAAQKFEMQRLCQKGSANCSWCMATCSEFAKIQRGRYFHRHNEPERMWKLGQVLLAWLVLQGNSVCRLTVDAKHAVTGESMLAEST